MCLRFVYEKDPADEGGTKSCSAAVNLNLIKGESYIREE